MVNSLDWEEVVKDTLKKLEADRRAVPGAKLRSEIDRAVEGELSRHLLQTGQSFSEFLSAWPDIKCHKRPGTDMVVGFQNAVVPIPIQLTGERVIPLRQDVYDAFTRVSVKPYWYLKASDEFTLEPTEGVDKVQVPEVRFEELLAERREFTESLEDPERRLTLNAAVNGSANPLGEFRRTVTELGLGRTWHEFKVKRLRDKLTNWAAENNLEPRATWFSHRDDRSDSVQDILWQLGRHMTDEEIRGLMVPFRSVEALYRSLRNRKPG